MDYNKCYEWQGTKLMQTLHYTLPPLRFNALQCEATKSVFRYHILNFTSHIVPSVKDNNIDGEEELQGADTQ